MISQSCSADFATFTFFQLFLPATTAVGASVNVCDGENSRRTREGVRNSKRVLCTTTDVGGDAEFGPPEYCEGEGIVKKKRSPSTLRNLPDRFLSANDRPDNSLEP